MAIGTRDGDSEALAQHWDGEAWSSQDPPNPSTAIDVYLEGIACGSSSQCIGVGSFENSSHEDYPLAEHWNGSSWSIQTTPSPSGASKSHQSWLEDVACPTPSGCIAVGTYEDSSNDKHGFGERWNGTSWSVESIPEPGAAVESTIRGVSCTGSAACTGVGSYETSTGSSYTFVVRWNGTSWSVQSSPNAEKASVNALADVTCLASVKCVAVGMSEGESGEVPLVIGWNGTAWAVETSPSVQAEGFHLDGVSCRKAADCITTGAATSDGRTWAVMQKSIEEKGGGGQATVLEAGEKLPVLTESQTEKVTEIIEEDASVEAALEGEDFEIQVGAWAERTAGNKTVLVGATALITVKDDVSTEGMWEWPAIDYESPELESGSYESSSLTAEAIDVKLFQLNVDTELDESGEVIGGDVVQLMPTALPGEDGEVEVSSEEELDTDPESQGY